MTTRARRVRRVHLRAPSETLVHRGRVLLEDAFHTATLPGAEGAKLVVVRRLDLGTVDARSGSPALALRLESSLRQIEASAVSVSSPGSERAPAVFFADPLQPLILLALRLAAGPAPTEWYWPLAVPDWRPELGRSDGLRLLLSLAHSAEAGVRGAAGLVGALVRSGAEGPLVESLTPSDAEQLLSWIPLEEAPRPLGSALRPGPSERGALQRAARRWGEADPRSLWLAAVLALDAEPALLASPRALLDVTTTWLRGSAVDPAGALGPGPGERVSPTAEVGRSSTGGGDARVGDGRSAESSRAEEERTDGGPPPAYEGGPGSPAVRAQEARDREDAGAPAPSSDRLIQSPFAGLFLLVRLLDGEGLTDFLVERPELVADGWARSLLVRIAARAGAALDDPAIEALYGEVDPDERNLLSRLAPSLGHRADTAAWLRRLRRRGRRVGIRALELVRRSGQIAWTRTHVDVFFGPNQGSLPIRRAGLDVDPGWVSWIGRVVTFHYRDGER